MAVNVRTDSVSTRPGAAREDSAARPDATVAAPARPVRPPWVVVLVGGVLALTAALVDQAVTDQLTDETVRQRLFLLFALPVAASFYLFMLAILASFPNRRRLWVGFLTAVLLSALVTHVLKWSVGRARPHMNLGPLHFRPFSGFDDLETFVRNGNFESFPSGHSSAAATLAVLLGLYFPRARWMFYFFAGVVGLERIVNDKHFLSDVLAGFVVGAGSVYACARVLGSRYYQKELLPDAGTPTRVTAGGELPTLPGDAGRTPSRDAPPARRSDG